MNTDLLKKKILELAIKGRLVEQRPEEGTAEDLYQQIQEEKAKLIKEGKIKKEKPLPPIEDDELPFDIPSSWKWVRFKNVVNYSLGRTPPRGDPAWWKNDVPWVSISDMTDFGYISNTKEKVSNKAITEKFKKVSDKGTLLMSFKLTIGRTSILQVRAVHNEAIISIFPYVKDNNIFRDYLFYGLPLFTSWVNGNNAIKGKTLNSTSITNLLLPLPPLAEQKRIVEKIDLLFSRLHTVEDGLVEIDKLSALTKKKILDLAIRGELVEQRPEEGTAEDLYQQIQEEKAKLIKEGKLKKEKSLAPIEDDEIPFDIPSNWKWVRLKNICSKIVDGDHNPPKGENSATDYLMLSASNINQDTLIDLTKARYLSKESYLQENERTKLEKGDILLTTVGTIGRSCIFQGGMNICFQRSVTVISTFVFNKYLKYMLDSNYVFSFMNNNAKGTAQKGFYLNQVDNLVVPIPPLAEQKRIVAKVEELLALCDKLKLK